MAAPTTTSTGHHRHPNNPIPDHHLSDSAIDLDGMANWLNLNHQRKSRHMNTMNNLRQTLYNYHHIITNTSKSYSGNQKHHHNPNHSNNSDDNSIGIQLRSLLTVLFNSCLELQLDQQKKINQTRVSNDHQGTTKAAPTNSCRSHEQVSNFNLIDYINNNVDWNNSNSTNLFNHLFKYITERPFGSYDSRNLCKVIKIYLDGSQRAKLHRPSTTTASTAANPSASITNLKDSIHCSGRANSGRSMNRRDRQISLLNRQILLTKLASDSDDLSSQTHDYDTSSSSSSSSIADKDGRSSNVSLIDDNNSNHIGQKDDEIWSGSSSGSSSSISGSLSVSFKTLTIVQSGRAATTRNDDKDNQNSNNSNDDDLTSSNSNKFQLVSHRPKQEEAQPNKQKQVMIESIVDESIRPSLSLSYDADDESLATVIMLPCHHTHENCHSFDYKHKASDRIDARSSQIIKHPDVCKLLFEFMFDLLTSSPGFSYSKQHRKHHISTSNPDSGHSASWSSAVSNEILKPILRIVERLNDLCLRNKFNIRCLYEHQFVELLMSSLLKLVSQGIHYQKAYLEPLLRLTFNVADYKIEGAHLRLLVDLMKLDQIHLETVLLCFERLLDHQRRLGANIKPFTSINFPAESLSWHDIETKDTYLANSWHCRLRKSVKPLEPYASPDGRPVHAANEFVGSSTKIGPTGKPEATSPSSYSRSPPTGGYNRKSKQQQPDSSPSSSSVSCCWSECSLMIPLSNVGPMVNGNKSKVFSSSMWISLCGNLLYIEDGHAGQNSNPVPNPKHLANHRYQSQGGFRQNSDTYWAPSISRRHRRPNSELPLERTRNYNHNNREDRNSHHDHHQATTASAMKDSEEENDDHYNKIHSRRSQSQRKSAYSKFHPTIDPQHLRPQNRLIPNWLQLSPAREPQQSFETSKMPPPPLEFYGRRTRHQSERSLMHLVSFAIDTLTIEIWLNVRSFQFCVRACRLEQGITNLLDEVSFASHLQANGDWSHLCFQMEEISSSKSNCLKLRVVVDGTYEEVDQLTYGLYNVPTNFACLVGCQKSYLGYMWKLSQVIIYKQLTPKDICTYLLGKGPDFWCFTHFKANNNQMINLTTGHLPMNGSATLTLPDISQRSPARMFQQEANNQLLETYYNVNEEYSLRWLTQNVMAVFVAHRHEYFVDYSPSMASSSFIPQDFEYKNSSDRFIQAKVLNFAKTNTFNHNNSVGPALTKLGGIDAMLICFAEVIRRTGDSPRAHALAFNVLLKASQTHQHHLYQFLDGLDGLNLVNYLLCHQKCCVSDSILETYMDYCFVRQGKLTLIKSSKLLYHLLSAWRAWHRNLQVAQLLYHELIQLLRPEDPNRVYNLKMMNEADCIDILLRALRESLVQPDDSVPQLNHDTIVLMVNLISLLIKHPPDLPVINEIMEFLLLLHPATESYVRTFSMDTFLYPLKYQRFSESGNSSYIDWSSGNAVGAKINNNQAKGASLSSNDQDRDLATDCDDEDDDDEDDSFAGHSNNLNQVNQAGGLNLQDDDDDGASQIFIVNSCYDGQRSTDGEVPILSGVAMPEMQVRGRVIRRSKRKRTLIKTNTATLNHLQSSLWIDSLSIGDIQEEEIGLAGNVNLVIAMMADMLASMVKMSPRNMVMEALNNEVIRLDMLIVLANTSSASVRVRTLKLLFNCLRACQSLGLTMLEQFQKKTRGFHLIAHQLLRYKTNTKMLELCYGIILDIDDFDSATMCLEFEVHENAQEGLKLSTWIIFLSLMTQCEKLNDIVISLQFLNAYLSKSILKHQEIIQFLLDNGLLHSIMKIFFNYLEDHINQTAAAAVAANSAKPINVITSENLATASKNYQNIKSILSGIVQEIDVSLQLLTQYYFKIGSAQLISQLMNSFDLMNSYVPNKFKYLIRDRQVVVMRSAWNHIDQCKLRTLSVLKKRFFSEVIGGLFGSTFVGDAPTSRFIQPHDEIGRIGESDIRKRIECVVELSIEFILARDRGIRTSSTEKQFTMQIFKILMTFLVTCLKPPAAPATVAVDGEFDLRRKWGDEELSEVDSVPQPPRVDISQTQWFQILNNNQLQDHLRDSLWRLIIFLTSPAESLTTDERNYFTSKILQFNLESLIAILIPSGRISYQQQQNQKYLLAFIRDILATDARSTCGGASDLREGETASTVYEEMADEEDEDCDEFRQEIRNKLLRLAHELEQATGGGNGGNSRILSGPGNRWSSSTATTTSNSKSNNNDTDWRGLWRDEWLKPFLANHKKNLEEFDERLKSKLDQSLGPLKNAAVQVTQNVNGIKDKERKQYIHELKQNKAHDYFIRQRWQSLIVAQTHERAAWYSSSHYPHSWELDPTEGPDRMRRRLRPCHLNLSPNYFRLPDQHHDNQWSSDSTNNNQSHALSSSFPRGPHPLCAMFESQERSMDSNALKSRLYTMGRITFNCPCKIVTQSVVHLGEISLGSTCIHFIGQRHEQNDQAHPVVVTEDFWFDEIRELWSRRYQLQDVGLELFLTNNLTYLLAFDSQKDREEFHQQLRQRYMANLTYHDQMVDLQGLSKIWSERKITNFQYLTYLNKLAGRSFNDLMQYPVFPFILSDYRSPILNLQSNQSFRRLSVPIAIQSSDREQYFRDHYEYLKSEYENALACERQLQGLSGTPASNIVGHQQTALASNWHAGTNINQNQNQDQQQQQQNRMMVGLTGATKPYHYSSHYSNSATVLHFLVRLPPYTQMLIQYQDGNFDLPDRTFHSMATSWQLSSRDSTTDFKELLPEFFFLPEMFCNLEQFDLGRRQNRQLVDDVLLPPWCRNGDPRLFTLIHRQALESDYVSEHLNEWIDLVFGYKQTGQPAIDAINVFHPATYYGMIDLSQMELASTNDQQQHLSYNELELNRVALQTMIRTFGQMPKQLFTVGHKQRRPLVPGSGGGGGGNGEGIGANDPTLQMGTRQIKMVLGEVIGLRWGSYVGSPADSKPIAVRQEKLLAGSGGYNQTSTLNGLKLLLVPSGELIALRQNSSLILNQATTKHSWRGGQFSKPARFVASSLASFPLLTVGGRQFSRQPPPSTATSSHKQQIVQGKFSLNSMSLISWSFLDGIIRIKHPAIGDKSSDPLIWADSIIDSITTCQSSVELNLLIVGYKSGAICVHLITSSDAGIIHSTTGLINKPIVSQNQPTTTSSTYQSMTTKGAPSTKINTHDQMTASGGGQGNSNYGGGSSGTGATNSLSSSSFSSSRSNIITSTSVMAATGTLAASNKAIGQTNSIIASLSSADKMTSRWLYCHTGPITSIAINKSFGIIVTASQDGTCAVWDLNNLTYIRTIDYNQIGAQHHQNSHTTNAGRQYSRHQQQQHQHQNQYDQHATTDNVTTTDTSSSGVSSIISNSTIAATKIAGNKQHTSSRQSPMSGRAHQTQIGASDLAQVKRSIDLVTVSDTLGDIIAISNHSLASDSRMPNLPAHGQHHYRQQQQQQSVAPTTNTSNQRFSGKQVPASILYVHTINGVLVNSLRCQEKATAVCCSTAPEGVSVNVIAVGCQDGVIRLYSSWDLTKVNEILIKDYAGPITGLHYSMDNHYLFVVNQEGDLITLRSQKKSSSSSIPKLRLIT